MAKKKIPVPAQAEVQEVTEPKVVKASFDNSHPEVSEESQVKSYNIRVSDHLAPVGNFNPKISLRTVCSGVWRYIAEDIESVDPAWFESQLAKEFGIKTNDLVYVVAKKKHKIVVV